MALADHVLWWADRRARKYLLDANVSFGSSGMALDIYGPAQPTASTPTIILWHGGSWQRGSKLDLAFIGGAFAKAGYITVIPDYRLAPAHPFPAYMEDAADAFAWTHHHITEYGGSNNNIFLMGHSAGAQIAALLLARPEFLKPHKLTLSGVRGLIGSAGPYDFTPIPSVARVFGNTNLDEVMPGRIFKQHPPKTPILLIHGALDFVVQPNQSKRLAKDIAGQGGTVELRIAPFAEHLLVIAGYAGGLWSRLVPSPKWTIDFIERYRR